MPLVKATGFLRNESISVRFWVGALKAWGGTSSLDLAFGQYHVHGNKSLKVLMEQGP